MNLAKLVSSSKTQRATCRAGEGPHGYGRGKRIARNAIRPNTKRGQSTEFGGKDLVYLGAHLGLPERAVRRVIENINKQVELWLPNIAG